MSHLGLKEYIVQGELALTCCSSQCNSPDFCLCLKISFIHRKSSSSHKTMPQGYQRMQSTLDLQPSSQSPEGWYNNLSDYVTIDGLSVAESTEEKLSMEVWKIFSGIDIAAWIEYATGSQCPEGIRDMGLGFEILRESLPHDIQKNLVSSSDILLRLLMTVDFQDELSLRHKLAPLLEGIRAALGQRSLARSSDSSLGDRMVSIILDQRVNYRLRVVQFRIRQLCTEKTQKCWNRLCDTIWIPSPGKVDSLAKELIGSYCATPRSSNQQESQSRSAHFEAVLRKTCNLSDRVHEAIVAAPENRQTYMELANVSNITTF
jgi:hypothetical protein